MLRKFIITALLITIFNIGVVANVSAARNDDTPASPKVTICHRTNSVTNPYNTQSVSESAVDGLAGNSGNEADHYGEHKGPLASSEAVAQGYKDAKTEWGDIIPPLAGVHAGLNWTVAGQAIYNNDCDYVAPVVTPVTPPIVPPSNGNTLGTSSGVVSPEAVSTSAPAPVGGVNAGGVASIISSLMALAASIGSLGYGILRLRKINR